MTRSRGIYAPKGLARSWLDEILLIEDRGQCIDHWPFFLNKEGYPRIYISGAGMVLVSHVVLERTGRPRPPAPGDRALHSCHRPICLAPWHLRWGTAAENSAEMVEAGRQERGESRHSAKLTEDDVRFIRSSVEPHTVLARRFGVKPAAIRAVRYGVTWRHVL